MKKNILFPFISILFFLGCAPIQFATQHRVENRIVEQMVLGAGIPTIVLETGMGPSMDTWKPILDSLGTISQVYAYNRPGYGASTLSSAPRDVVQVVQQLRANLKSNNIPPPYLLMGHSAGGLYVNMFARLYPNEVVGVIFLDASHPSQFEYFKSEHRILYNTLIMSTQKSRRTYERDLIESAKSDFINAPQFPDIPISVLTAGKKSSLIESKKLREQWLVFQKELVNLSPKSNHVIVQGSGHFVHKDSPEVVIAEVHRILNTFRK